jgi:hypothetical protein
MKQMIAFCGLSCTGCDAFPVNQNKMTANEKIKVAEKWSVLYGHGGTIKAEDILCDGCQSKGGALFNYCSVCEIRKCGMEKHITNCAYCADYTCEKLEKFFTMAPTAKANLEEIRKSA